MDFIKKSFTYFATFFLSVLFIFIIVYQITMSLPGNWFVNIHKMHYHDMCLGDQIQIITTKRSIRGNGILAKSFSELYKLDNQKIVETIIKRKAEFIYQKNENEFNIEIKWNSPILEEGEYIVHETITIFPFMNIPIQFNPPESNFRVTQCNPFGEE